MNNPSQLEAGKNYYEFFDEERNHKPVRLCRLNYRHHNGTLYTCTKNTFKECQEARDNWIESVET